MKHKKTVEEDKFKSTKGREAFIQDNESEVVNGESSLDEDLSEAEEDDNTEAAKGENNEWNSREDSKK